MFPAVMITLIGFFSSVVIGKTLAQVHGYRISANRDLCALGVANLLGSVFLAYPTFGAIPRSAVAHMAGAKTQLHALVAATLVLITILFLTPLFYYFPSYVYVCVLSVCCVCVCVLCAYRS
jgi:sulfate permease, SulP family